MSESPLPSDVNPLDVLAWEQPRTHFVLQGWRRADGSPGGEYSVARHSLQMALADLDENGVSGDGPYFVEDVLVEQAEHGGVVVRVQLRSMIDVLGKVLGDEPEDDEEPEA